MAEIIDLRGRERVPTRAPVLSDPSGRRARLLARAGRVAAAALMLWIAGLALAGLGVLPVGDVPLGHVIAGPSPPALRAIPAPARPSADDLKPAVPVAVLHASAAANAAGQAQTRPAGAFPSTTVHRGPGGGRRPHPSGSGHRGGPGVSSGGGSTGTGPVPKTNPSNPTAAGTATGAPASHAAGSSTAPGQSTKLSAPGHTATSTPGNSAAAPGQVKQTTTTTTTTTVTSAPGQSGSAPGQTATHGSDGHGHNN